MTLKRLLSLLSGMLVSLCLDKDTDGPPREFHPLGRADGGTTEQSPTWRRRRWTPDAAGYAADQPIQRNGSRQTRTDLEQSARERGQEQHALTGHTGAVERLAVAPDGSWLASGGEDLTVGMSDPTRGEPVAALRTSAHTEF